MKILIFKITLLVLLFLMVISYLCLPALNSGISLLEIIGAILGIGSGLLFWEILTRILKNKKSPNT